MCENIVAGLEIANLRSVTNNNINVWINHFAEMANPRKFSEKIALHNQKQAEETAEFNRIMKEVSDATNKVSLVTFIYLYCDGLRCNFTMHSALHHPGICSHSVYNEPEKCRDERKLTFRIYIGHDYADASASANFSLTIFFPVHPFVECKRLIRTLLLNFNDPFSSAMEFFCVRYLGASLKTQRFPLFGIMVHLID